MPKTLDLRKKEFDGNHAYDLMVKRIREEVLEEAARAPENTYIAPTEYVVRDAARVVRRLK